VTWRRLMVQVLDPGQYVEHKSIALLLSTVMESKWSPLGLTMVFTPLRPITLEDGLE
jgi:hypothetical protein